MKMNMTEMATMMANNTALTGLQIMDILAGAYPDHSEEEMLNAICVLNGTGNREEPNYVHTMHEIGSFLRKMLSEQRVSFLQIICGYRMRSIATCQRVNITEKKANENSI